MESSPVNYWGTRKIRLFNLGVVAGSELFIPKKFNFGMFYWSSVLIVQRTKHDEIPLTESKGTM